MFLNLNCNYSQVIISHKSFVEQHRFISDNIILSYQGIIYTPMYKLYYLYTRLYYAFIRTLLELYGVLLEFTKCLFRNRYQFTKNCKVE